MYVSRAVKTFLSRWAKMIVMENAVCVCFNFSEIYTQKKFQVSTGHYLQPPDKFCKNTASLSLQLEDSLNGTSRSHLTEGICIIRN